MDAIRVEGLRFEGTHGVYAEERRRPQPFLVDLELRLDLAAAGSTDELADTCDYSTAARIAADVLAGPSHRLIEALAEQIAARLLAAFPQLTEARVRVHKPEAPLGLPFADVQVEICRGRC